jgi:quercetin dioxygenase-like cupin family protein
VEKSDPEFTVKEHSMTTTTQTTAIDFLGVPTRVLAGGGGLGLVHQDVPAGDMPPLHVHRNEDEGFYCLGGEITLYLPGEAVTLWAGDFFLAPRDVPHTYETGADGARVLVSSTPSGFERFVVEVAALEAVSPEILGRVAAEHGIEILGPPGARP